jgi:hypothetical protein
MKKSRLGGGGGKITTVGLLCTRLIGQLTTNVLAGNDAVSSDMQSKCVSNNVAHFQTL